MLQDYNLYTLLLQITSVVGCLVILGTVVFSFILSPYMRSADWKAYVGGFCLPAIGLVVGFVVPKILRMDYTYARTVAIETAFQNFPLCFAVITLSFERQHMIKLLMFPVVTSCGILFNNLVFVLGYRLLKVVKGKREGNENRKYKYKSVSKDEAKKAVELELFVELHENNAIKS